MIVRAAAILIATTLSLRAVSIQEIYGFPGGTTNLYPNSLTLASDGAFYGTTSAGGAGYGTVFRISSSGQYTNLASFTSTNGSTPQAALTQGSDGAFYGTTFLG